MRAGRKLWQWRKRCPYCGQPLLAEYTLSDRQMGRPPDIEAIVMCVSCVKLALFSMGCVRHGDRGDRRKHAMSSRHEGHEDRMALLCERFSWADGGLVDRAAAIRWCQKQRAKLGWTYTQVSRASGVSHTAVSRILRGLAPHAWAETVVSMAVALAHAAYRRKCLLALPGVMV